MGGYVYLMSNRKDGTLYLGVTNNIARRAFEHREGILEGFTKRYGIARLVWAEWHDDIRSAIQRERTMKHWPRAWKVRLIHQMNPDWDDLYEVLNG
ncbi:GIY-YIG nuclease family protein [Kaistia geumhonensis]|uniref:Endonuclease n=1 Tax=Kaistia geumhonensis TaxID=410839 RepID=A0ABU0M9L7_9HYPH|nr:GIY-YIG nuclease family protein [Kaistia geumhonensis]MCX5480622.1 GIY-YIG nuclease family protein [Kaistia geumhonensis]MDQ0517675.1 putative endonuclease [Kaistia geumhonensis]